MNTIELMIAPSKKQRERHLPFMGNWITLHKYLGKILSNPKTAEKKLHELLHLELHTRSRLDIITRLHSQYCSVRKIREKKQLIQILSGLKS